MSSLLILEQWLQVLLTSYQSRPCCQLAKAIYDYISRILADEDCIAETAKQCQYLRMKRFWYWNKAASTKSQIELTAENADITPFFR